MTRFVVRADDAAHTFTFSGEPHSFEARAEGVSFQADAGMGPSRSFQVFNSGQSAPSTAKFLETVLVPVDELRWWHLFELNVKEEL